jgi:hypothetical protein
MSTTKPLDFIARGLVRQAITDIEAALAGIDKVETSAEGWKRHQAQVDAMAVELGKSGIEVGDNSLHGGVVKYCSIRATSTSGVTGALQNWIVAARKRLAA